MTKNNSQPEAAWGNDNKTWWKRRSELERKLLIALSVAVFVVVGFLVYVAIKRKAIAAYAETCTTPGCLLAASQIITHINTDVDPCDDFFKFACGKFIEHIHGDLKAASVHSVQDQVERQLNEIIGEPISDDDHSAIKSQKRLFEACMNETAVEEESLDIFKEMLEELNGWPVVVGYKWKESFYDWTEMIYKLRRKGYPHEMMLSLNTIPDPGDEGHYIVHISPPFVKDIKDRHKELYKKYMTDIAVAFGADRNRHDLGRNMEKVLDFMERLSKVAEKNIWSVDNNETDYNYTAALLDRRFKVDDFQDYNNEMDWLTFINNVMFPVANISGDDYAIFPKSDFLEAFFALTYNTPKRIQADYIIWTIVDDLIQHLSKELKHIEGNYTCLTKEQSQPKDRFEYCSMVISASFYPLPAEIIYARRYLPPEKREKVQELFDSVKTEFRSLLEESTWMDDESKEKSFEKADGVTAVIGAPGDYFDDAVFENYQSDEELQDEENQGTSFLTMLLNRIKVQDNRIFSRINQPTNGTDEVFYSVITKVNGMFSPMDNTMILPAGILQGIFYSEDRPMYLNYGTLGSIIGHEITHGFCKDASKFDKEGNKGNVWTEETEKAYDEVTQCMIEDAEEFDVEDTENTINGTLTLEENIADFAGLKVSYAAYKNWVKENGEELQLAGVDYTPYQLFWISAISYECFKLTGEKLEKGLENDVHAHNAFRATGPMRNNENFANDFNCPDDSKMNPSEKCQVF